MQVFDATSDHLMCLARLASEAFRHGDAPGIFKVSALCSIPGLPVSVVAFLAGLAPDRRMMLHQRGIATVAGARFYIDPDCRPATVDSDHFAADDPDACYVVKGIRMSEAVVISFADDFTKVQYKDGRTELVYQAQIHEARLTATWDVADWQAESAAGGSR